MDANLTISPAISTIRNTIELRANSAIITIFGDAILPRGGNIWLGSLIELAHSLGISERLVRTGVYRLSQEGWLTSHSQGRRAYYALTEPGEEKFNEAQRRIYAVEPVNWDGVWRMVQLLPQISTPTRKSLKRELGWLGFGQISPTMFIHPTEPRASVERVLKRLDAEDDTLVFRAELSQTVQSDRIQNIVRTAWTLDALNAEYARFISTFIAFESATSATLTSIDAFVLRILLVHDYRRLLLKDPVLPDQLLPGDWNGTQARILAATIYRQIASSADRFVVDHLQTDEGETPPLSRDYWARFGGLEKVI